MRGPAGLRVAGAEHAEGVLQAASRQGLAEAVAYLRMDGWNAAGRSPRPPDFDNGWCVGAAGPSGAKAAEEPAAPAEPKFLAFGGGGRRLDGKPASEPRPVPIPAVGLRATSGAAGPSDAAAAAGASGSSAGGSGSATRKAGKLMFKDRLAAKFAKVRHRAAHAVPAFAFLRGWRCCDLPVCRRTTRHRRPAVQPGQPGAAPPPAPKPEEKKEDKGNGFTAFKGTANRLK